MSDYRNISGLVEAYRAKRTFPKAKPSNTAAQEGLRFERKVGRELQRHTEIGNFIRVEHNPWFTFHDDYGMSNCSPDFLLYDEKNWIIVVEVKLTWIPSAEDKLRRLYGPVVRMALGMPVKYLVICKATVPTAPRAQLTFSEALASPVPLLLWPPLGRLQW